MISILRLSRLAITGPLDSHTPWVVYQEIADVHGVANPFHADGSNFNEYDLEIFLSLVREKIADTKSLVSLPLNSEHSRNTAANFVNPRVHWPVNELMEAFEFIRMYMGGPENCPLPLPRSGSLGLPQDFDFGQQTPASPRSVNACILYKICKIYHLPITFGHGYHHMAEAIRIMRLNEPSARMEIRLQLQSIPSEHLPHIYLLLSEYEDDMNVDPLHRSVFTEEDATYTNIEETVRLLSDQQYLRSKIQARTTTEAIALAALNFGVDISASTMIFEEYQNLVWQGKERWRPLDTEMARNTSINPFYYHLDLYFNPRLPQELYDHDDLKTMAIEEGYLPSDMLEEDPYSLMITACLSKTFFHGPMPGITNSATSIYFEPIEDLDKHDILCWGIRGGAMIATSYQELAALLREQKNFGNPLDNDPNFPEFSDMNIRKLKRICHLSKDGESEDQVNNRMDLLSAIALCELYTEESLSKLRNLREMYEEARPEKQEQIKETILSFFKLSMHLRGWLGSEPYPIESSPVTDQLRVDILCTEAILDFERRCSDLGELGNQIMKLPLFKYNRGGWKMASSSDDETRDIRTRLDVLKTGEDYDGYNSCMRLTSNWFASSAFRYMTVVGIQPPFEIERLRDIS